MKKKIETLIGDLKTLNEFSIKWIDSDITPKELKFQAFVELSTRNIIIAKLENIIKDNPENYVYAHPKVRRVAAIERFHQLYKEQCPENGRIYKTGIYNQIAQETGYSTRAVRKMIGATPSSCYAVKSTKDDVAEKKQKRKDYLKNYYQTHRDYFIEYRQKQKDKKNLNELPV